MIHVAQDPNGGPSAIALSGTGTTPLTAVPASIAFGTVVDGHSSVNRTVTVYNYGGAAATLGESVIGSNSADFTVDGGTCGATLAGSGAHCTYTLKFTPSIVGGESATLGASAVGRRCQPAQRESDGNRQLVRIDCDEMTAWSDLGSPRQFPFLGL